MRELDKTLPRPWTTHAAFAPVVLLLAFHGCGSSSGGDGAAAGADGPDGGAGPNVTGPSGAEAGRGPDGAARPADGSVDATSGVEGGGPQGAIAPGSSGAVTAGGVRWVGRVDASNATAARFAWQGAGVLAVVSGATIAVKLRTEGTDTVFFQPVVDGVAGARFEVTQGGDKTVTLGASLSGGDHVVELYRDTEGAYGVSTFLGFTSGTVKGAPAPNDRLVEVVGDSISAGYGNLGVEPHPNWTANPACHWTAENSTWFQTYAALAAHQLNAEVSTLALSGWGVYRDRSSDPNGVLPKVYGNTLGTSSAPPWGFASKASAVVINLGTNDWAPGDPGTAYETAYGEFLKTVRGNYPNAWIFIVIGSMLGDQELTQAKGRLATIVAARVKAGDARVSTFDLGIQDMGADGSVPTGCDWHPNIADHKRMSGILKGQLAARLGW